MFIFYEIMGFGGKMIIERNILCSQTHVHMKSGIFTFLIYVYGTVCAPWKNGNKT